MSTPYAETCRPFLEANLFLFRVLPEDERARLLERMEAFIKRKFWEGCAGLEVTDEMRVTVAAQACVLLLGLPGYHFDGLKTILLYPGGFLWRGEFDDERELKHVLGTAPHEGPVILSWWHSRWQGQRSDDHNLVIHEFAHKLAELGDPRRGLPPFRTPELVKHWEDVVAEEFDRLEEDVSYGRPTLLRPYGAANRPEFFAVATECFFLRPAALRERHPGLYEFLNDCYQQDPAAWPWESHPIGLTLEEVEEYDRHTIEECSEAIRRHPQRDGAYSERARCYRALGEYDKAVADYTRAIERVRPRKRAALLAERGLTHLRAERPAEAIADFDEAVRRSPDCLFALCGRAAAYRLLGEHRRALADLNRVLSRNHQHDSALVERARVQLALGKKGHALNDATRAIHLAPYDAEAYRARAEVYASRGQHDKARADREEAGRCEDF